MHASLTPARYFDKVLGGWVGKCAGGILGAPIEGYKAFNEIELTDELFANNFANDDLDLQVLWLDMMARKGRWVRGRDFADHWLRHVDFPWNEYGIAARNLRLGLDPPDSGRHNNWYWRHSMGSPIRSEIWGMLFPGDPATAARYAQLDSELDHVGFSVEAERYLSACAALAFVEEDPRVVLQRGLEYVTADGLLATLAGHVEHWYAAYGFAVTAGKIKSHYGDADFTSAPMNIGFTLLALHHAGRDFDRVVKALHLGHDSDCVVATAGALLGILVGYAAIPATWKRRVGNELLISPEITGIDCPDSLTGLAAKTCAVGQALAESTAPPPRPFALHCEVSTRPDPPGGTGGRLRVFVENLGPDPLSGNCRLSSPFFAETNHDFSVDPGATRDFPLDLSPLTGPPPARAETAWPYRLEVAANGTTHTFTKGIPAYGEWLLVGPFLRDDPSLAPLDPTYPDHGLASMPAVSYMNHDATDRETDHLTHAELDALLDGEQRDGRPYGVRTIRPAAMSVDLGRYFYGKGERTLYLTTRIHCAAATRQWLCLGSANHLAAWLNGRPVLRTETLRRRWPGTAVAELELAPGENTLTLRMDTVTDDYRLDVGLKDHAGRHHHQSAWNTTLAFAVPPETRAETSPLPGKDDPHAATLHEGRKG